MTDDQIQHILAALERFETGQESLQTGQNRLRADLMDRLQHEIVLVRR
jgi:hypothetical protein